MSDKADRYESESESITLRYDDLVTLSELVKWEIRKIDESDELFARMAGLPYDYRFPDEVRAPLDKQRAGLRRIQGLILSARGAVEKRVEG